MIEEKDGKLVCDCGAKADPKDRKRFTKRHADGSCVARKLQREAFSKQLAQRTRCVDEVEGAPTEEDCLLSGYGSYDPRGPNGGGPEDQE